jgi:hypothetical protein
VFSDWPTHCAVNIKAHRIQLQQHFVVQLTTGDPDICRPLSLFKLNFDMRVSPDSYTYTVIILSSIASHIRLSFASRLFSFTHNIFV